MSNPIYIIASVIRKCPFSKKIIKPKNMLCVFDKYQYNNFVFQIAELLLTRLPRDIIHIIIELINYKRLLNRVGLEKFVNWNLDQSTYFLSDTKLARRKNQLLYNSGFGSDSGSDSDSGFDSGSDSGI